MQQIPTSSSLIVSASYDEQQQVLTVTFKSGASWAYGDASQPFTQSDADMFTGAVSKGKWFLEQIKDSFPARRV